MRKIRQIQFGEETKAEEKRERIVERKSFEVRDEEETPGKVEKITEEKNTPEKCEKTLQRR